MVWWMAVPAAAGRIYKGGKWVKEIIKARKTAANLKSPSKLSKDVTTHTKTQKVRAQIADSKSDFPTAKSIKESGIKLKDLDTKSSRKGISQVKHATKDKLSRAYKNLM